VEPKFKKVFSMFFLCFHVMKWKIHHHNNELEEFRLKMMILMKFDEKYASCNGMTSRNISDCSHFLILVSIRTALLTNIKFGEGWSQPSNETQNLVDRSRRPKNIIQYYYHAIWKWYIYTYMRIKHVCEQCLHQYNASRIIFRYIQICLNDCFV